MNVKTTCRLSRLGAVLAIGALALTGCGRAGTETAAKIDDKPATGKIQFWYGGGSPDAVKSIAKDFEAENPGVTVEVTHVPEANLDAKVLAAITAGKVPDVVHIVNYTERAMLETGGFAPVPEGIADPAEYFGTTWQQGEIDGVAHAVPWDVTTAVLQYRKDLAEKAGVQAPTNWQEFGQFAKALQGAGATYGFALNVGYDQYAAADYLNFVQQNGGSFMNADETKWTINDPKNVDALEYTWGSMVRDKVASPDGPLFLDTVPWFTKGEVGSIVMGPWFETWLTEAKGEEWTKTHLATAPVPAGVAGSISGMSGDVVAVPKDAKNSDAAWKLVRYLGQPEVQVKLYQQSGLLPATKSAWKLPTIANDRLLDPFKSALETAKSTPQASTWNQVAPIIGQALEKVARGQMTSQQALDEAQKRAEAIGVGKNGR